MDNTAVAKALALASSAAGLARRGQGVDRLNGAEPFACVPTIKLSFTPFRTKPVGILYKPTLLYHIIFGIV